MTTNATTDTDRDLAELGVRLLDDAYMTWFVAETQAQTALNRWFDTTGAMAGSAYLAYRAAVDREEAAARDLERLSQVTAPCQERLTLDHGAIR